jgi:hypothetical protein
MSKWDLVWPTLEERSGDSQKTLEADLEEIGKATWPSDPQGALAEAREIEKREEERRTSTDSKASNYLLVIVAIMPLLTYLESTVWGQAFGTAPRWLSLIVLSASVAFLLGASHWAFKTLRVGTFHVLSAAELQAFWKSDNRQDRLVNEILKNIRRNSDAINDKVSCMKMAHIFLKRGIVYFGALILLQAAWALGQAAWPGLHQLIVHAILSQCPQ